MDSISATGRIKQKYAQLYYQHFRNGRISLKNRARFVSRALARFGEKGWASGRAVRAAGGEGRLDGVSSRVTDMKSMFFELFSVLFFYHAPLGTIGGTPICEAKTTGFCK